MNKYHIKVTLSLLALVLWIVSLLTPVLNDGRVILPGIAVLAMTMTFGVLALYGIPWAALNIFMFVLLYKNLRGHQDRMVAWLFLFICVLVTAIAVMAEIGNRKFVGGEMWHYGMLFWTGGMFLMGIAALFRCGANELMQDAGSPPPNNSLNRTRN